MFRPTVYIIIIFFIISAITGPIAEYLHNRKMQKREDALAQKPIVNFGVDKLGDLPPIKKVELVTGEIVIGADYCRSFISRIGNIFGWNLYGLGKVIERGRREAILRMRENAKDANIIVNTRIQMVRVNKNSPTNIGASQCSIVVYGTAITYDLAAFQKHSKRREIHR